MSQSNSEFEQIIDTLMMETAKAGTISDTLQVRSILHAFILAWMNEDDCLVWITSVPGGNVFGSTVVFVNDKVLQELQWSFTEWENGTAPAAVFRPAEQERIKMHMAEKSRLPMLVHVRKKNTPNNQEGQDYILHIHYDLPYNLRLTVAAPS